MIKILVLNSDNDGVGYWRLLSPYLTINNPEFKVDVRLLQDFTLNLTEEGIKGYDIIVYNKNIPFRSPQIEDEFYRVLKRNNITIIYDIDDHWMLDSSHINYKNWKESNAKETVINTIKKADFVTTTTSLFAKDIKEYNDNVMVFPNAVNSNENQWDYNNKIKSDKLRFIWGGGISHLPDLRYLTDSFKKFNNKFLEECQLYLCGFDLRVRTQQGMMKDNPMRSTWTQFENIFTNNYRWITNNKHREWLMKFDNDNVDLYGYNEEFKDEFYQRRFTKPIFHYGTQYREADVALAPLKEGLLFNTVKSELKVVEAGAYHLPIIASNVGPYTLCDIEGKKDGKQKGFLINNTDSLGWWNAMKFYQENKDVVLEHGENMWEYVKNNYEVKPVNDKRMEFFKSIVK